MILRSIKLTDEHLGAADPWDECTSEELDRAMKILMPFLMKRVQGKMIFISTPAGRKGYFEAQWRKPNNECN
jgi:hypothetical protein